METKGTATPLSTNVLNAFWRALYPLNFLLIVIALVQGLVLYVLQKREFALPDFANVFVKSALSGKGIDLGYTSATISINGRLKINDVKLRFEGTPSEFFKAEKIDASFYLSGIFDGDIKPRDIRIFNGRLGDSIRGVEKKSVFYDIFLSASSAGQWWEIESAHFKIGGLTADISAKISENFSLAEFLSKNGFEVSAPPRSRKGGGNDAPPQLGEVADKLSAALADCEKYSKYIDYFTTPVCKANFFLSGAESCAGWVAFRSQSAKLPINNTEAKLENLGVDIKYNGGKIADGVSTFLRAEKFSGIGLPSVNNCSLSANLVASGKTAALENVDIAVANIEYDGIKIDNVSLRKDYLDMDSVGNDWRLFVAFDKYRFGARFSVSPSLRLDAHFSGSLNPQIVTGHKTLAGIKELREFAFDKGLSLKGNASFSFSDYSGKANVDFEAADCLVMNIPILRVSGKVAFDSADGLIDASDVFVQSREGWEVAGRFVQNINDFRYWIYIDGSIRPMAIAHFMAPWWDRVFKSFEWSKKGAFPRADFAVEGRWGYPDFIWCYGNACGESAVYNGSKFDDFSLYVWVNPERITLYDVRLKAQNRNAHGNIQWLYGAHGLTTFERQTLYFVSGLAPSELVSLGGDDVSEVFSVLKFSEAPQIVINGLLRNPHNNPDKLRDIFNVSGFASGETAIETATLKNLRFAAKSDKIVTQVEEASFEFCQGNGDGSITLDKSGGKMTFEASARASRMNQEDFTKFLLTLDTSAEAESSTGNSGDKKGSGFLEGGESGIVDLSMNLRGYVDDIAHSSGEGFVNLTNPNLMRLNLFGALSRAFSALRLPLGSFELTYANSPVKIGEGKVDFPKLEMGGAVMRIRGAAAYDFIKDDIDATMAIYPFGGMTTPLLAGIVSLVHPISSVIQVTVDGKISDPIIGMNVKPMNLIESDKKILEEIRDSF